MQVLFTPNSTPAGTPMMREILIAVITRRKLAAQCLISLFGTVII
jgi:hypothetical protein